MSERSVAATDPRPPAGPPVPVRRLLRWAAVLVLLGAVAYTLLLSAPGLADVRAALRSLRPGVLMAAVALEVVVVLARAQVYRACLAAVGVPMAARPLLNVSMSAFTVTQVLPGGGAWGALVAARRMTRLGATRAAAVGAVALMGTLMLVTLGAVVAAALAGSLLLGAAPDGAVVPTVLALLVVVAVAGVVLAVLRSAPAANRILDAIQRLGPGRRLDLPRWRASIAQVADDPPTPARVARVMGWSAVTWLMDAGALWLVAGGLGHRLPIDVWLLGYSVQHLAVMVPLSPGGLGLVEAGMVGAYVALGVPSAVAVPTVLVYRIVAYWLPLLAGVPAFLRPPGRRTAGAPT